MLLSSFQKDSLSSPLKGNPQTIPNAPCTHFPSHSSGGLYFGLVIFLYIPPRRFMLSLSLWAVPWIIYSLQELFTVQETL